MQKIYFTVYYIIFYIKNYHIILKIFKNWMFFIPIKFICHLPFLLVYNTIIYNFLQNKKLQYNNIDIENI